MQILFKLFFDCVDTERRQEANFNPPAPLKGVLRLRRHCLKHDFYPQITQIWTQITQIWGRITRISPLRPSRL